MADSQVPPGYSSPFAKVTTDDHTAWVVITTLLGLIYSILFALVRTFLSWTTGGGKGHADDFALLVSTVRRVYRDKLSDHYVSVRAASQRRLTHLTQAFAIVQCSIVLGACSVGFGKTWRLVPETSHDKVQQVDAPQIFNVRLPWLTANNRCTMRASCSSYYRLGRPRSALFSSRLD